MIAVLFLITALPSPGIPVWMTNPHTAMGTRGRTAMYLYTAKELDAVVPGTSKGSGE